MRDSPTTTESVRNATKTEMRAVLLTICEDNFATLDRTLDCLRVLSRYKEFQGDTGNVENEQVGVRGDVGQEAQVDGTVEWGVAPTYHEDMSCIHCEGIDNYGNNHSTAFRRHQGTLLRSSGDSGMSFWTCCRGPANQPGCVEGYHSYE
ncbi:hypothetical protein VMCG_04796 [Cytospora schulzeri]|uniref:Uncharacterized protein n=1 Tax=Cytospora schulzeri TaxID=448051 RepID=A0A423WMQ2_9PEZI|nr:hypothetical protein VMCG_04796 [Valsa malicola]